MYVLVDYIDQYFHLVTSIGKSIR